MFLVNIFIADILVWEFESLNFPCPVSVLVMCSVYLFNVCIDPK